jgi:hypothetical protein
MNILIAVPTFESIYPDTFKSIYDIDKGGHQLAFEFVRGYDCATARNKIAQKAIDMDVDYVLMVDNDTVIPSDILITMTDDLKDVCLGYYAHRGNDNLYSGRTNICKLYQEDGVKYFNYPLESEYTADEMDSMRERGEYKVQIHGGGMGCAFIKTDVFRTLKYPWYDWVNYADDHRGMLSEDLFFCELCRKARIPIYTDTRSGCGHILRHVQWCV